MFRPDAWSDESKSSLRASKSALQCRNLIKKPLTRLFRSAIIQTTACPLLHRIPAGLGRQRKLSRFRHRGTRPRKCPKNRSRAKVIDKSVLALSEPRRIWDRDHVRYVVKQPCLICGRRPAMPTTCASHKAGCSNERSAMISPSRCAEETIARCTVSAKSAWWKKAGIDPTENARALWLKTRPLPTTGKPRVRGYAAG